VSLHELAAARGSLGLPLKRDLHFARTRTIAAYAELAREHRCIVTGSAVHQPPAFGSETFRGGFCRNVQSVAVCC
jgi:Protein of unknown function (DUF2958)